MIADAEKISCTGQGIVSKDSLMNSLVAETNKANEVKELADLMDWLELDSETASSDDMKRRGRVIEDTWGYVIA
ncbi:hypothetical protein ACHAW6_004386 [Cyclotella cf. meneghiniana]